MAQRYLKWLCSFVRKKAVIGNSLVAIVAAGIMLTSKGAKSYEMVIVARILNGYSAGKPHSMTSIIKIMFWPDWQTSCLACRFGAQHSFNVPEWDFTQKVKRHSDADLCNLCITGQTVWAVFWTKVWTESLYRNDKRQELTWSFMWMRAQCTECTVKKMKLSL